MVQHQMLERGKVKDLQELFEVVIWNLIIGKIEVLQLIGDYGWIERIDDGVSWKIQRNNAWTNSFDITVIAEVDMLQTCIPAAF